MGQAEVTGQFYLPDLLIAMGRPVNRASLRVRLERQKIASGARQARPYISVISNRFLLDADFGFALIYVEVA